MEYYRGSPKPEVISRLLDTALDDDEGYDYEGEFTTYTCSYASDAAAELRTIFTMSEPTADEIALCLQELCNQRRLDEGRSRRLLRVLGDQARSTFAALGLPEPSLEND